MGSHHRLQEQVHRKAQMIFEFHKDTLFEFTNSSPDHKRLVAKAKFPGKLHYKPGDEIVFVIQETVQEVREKL